MSKIRKSIRITFVVAATAATLSLGSGTAAHASRPAGPFNCALGPTALPDDRWSSCAFASPDYPEIGYNSLPDDRWPHDVK
jgi:hypothetical protein